MTQAEIAFDDYMEKAPPNPETAQLYAELHKALESYVNALVESAWIAGFQAGRSETHDQTGRIFD